MSVRFIFLYSPCYNLAYNALTYSKSLLSTFQSDITDKTTLQHSWSSCSPSTFVPKEYLSSNGLAAWLDSSINLWTPSALQISVSSAYFRCATKYWNGGVIRMEILHQVNIGSVLKRSRSFPISLNTRNLSYCAFLAFEVLFVYIFFPETSGRSLEELAFCELGICYCSFFWDEGSLYIPNSVRRWRAHGTEKTCREGNQTGHEWCRHLSREIGVKY